MEAALRAVLIDWLASDPVLSESLNSVTEEVPLAASLPWLALAASAAVDWSHKTGMGREVRVALELHMRADRPELVAETAALVEQRVMDLPRLHAGFQVVSVQFLRSRAEQRGEAVRALLMEYRFRILAG